MRVLHIDSDMVARKSVELGALAQEWEMIESRDVFAHLKFADCVIVEPNRTNYVQLIRQQGYRKALVVLSHVTDVGHVLTCFEQGADDYVAKPCDVRELIARIIRIDRVLNAPRAGEPVRHGARV